MKNRKTLCRKTQSIVYGLIFLILSSCSMDPPIDLENEKEEIMTIHNNQRLHHFQKDSVAFARQLSDRFVSVNRGEVNRPTFEETKKRLNQYFSAVEFIKWDDTATPEIRFSEDGRMAYTIVEKELLLHYLDEGVKMEEQTTFAWVSIYTKGVDGWRIDCVSSTNKPSVTTRASQD
ncbi:MAG: hypothetical protein ABJP45_13435 [Cyclobacteriaceae bacterium]